MNLYSEFGTNCVRSDLKEGLPLFHYSNVWIRDYKDNPIENLTLVHGLLRFPYEEKNYILNIENQFESPHKEYIDFEGRVEDFKFTLVEKNIGEYFSTEIIPNSLGGFLYLARGYLTDTSGYQIRRFEFREYDSLTKNIFTANWDSLAILIVRIK